MARQELGIGGSHEYLGPQCGSSSPKFQVISTDPDHIAKDADERPGRREVERIGGEANRQHRHSRGERQETSAQLRDITAAIRRGLAASGQEDIHAVGYRVVHGSERFTESVLSTPEVLKGIEDCIDMAPLHNPTNLKGIAAAAEAFGRKIPQVAGSTQRFISQFPNMPTRIPFRTICTGVTVQPAVRQLNPDDGQMVWERAAQMADSILSSRFAGRGQFNWP